MMYYSAQCACHIDKILLKVQWNLQIRIYLKMCKSSSTRLLGHDMTFFALYNVFTIHEIFHRTEPRNVQFSFEIMRVTSILVSFPPLRHLKLTPCHSPVLQIFLSPVLHTKDAHLLDTLHAHVLFIPVIMQIANNSGHCD